MIKQSSAILSAPPADPDPVIVLAREERLTLGLLQAAVQLQSLKSQILRTDLERFPSLQAFITSGDSLIGELGYSDA